MSGPTGQTAPETVSSLWTQRTLKSRIPCVGIGVHSGRRVSVTLLPAPAGHGIVFRRTTSAATSPPPITASSIPNFAPRSVKGPPASARSSI